jgi:beta-ribofuranosylaminobenzene 5'-phosphate synthase
MNGNLGRIDGGLGVSLQEPKFVINAEISDTDSFDENVKEIIEKLRKNNLAKQKYHIRILSNIPSHVGLGSKTQLSLAVAKSVTKLDGLDLDTYSLAKLVGRGGTSGIGVAAFHSGGFILDGGHSKLLKKSFAPSRYSIAPPPPVLARYDFPKDWYFVISIPAGTGIHGKHELKIFQRFCPIPSREVEKLSRIIFSIILPSVIEKHISNFGKGISMIQNIGFKKIENKLRGKEHLKLLKFMTENSEGAGLSSFGPATYAIVEGRKNANNLALKVKEFMQSHNMGSNLFITQASNTGAICTEEQ